MPTLNDFTQNIRTLVSKDQLKPAIEQLRQLLDNTPQLDEAMLLSARYNALMKDIRTGVLYQETEEVSKNKLRRTVLDLVSCVEEETEENPKLEQEAAQTLQENAERFAKINTQTITGDGNVGVQDVSGSQINIKK